MSDQLSVVKELLRIEEVIGEGASQTIVKETLTVPTDKPPVAQIIDYEATPEVTGETIVADKVIVSGNVHLKTIYEAKTSDQSVHAMHHTVPFEGFVEIPGARPGMKVYPTVSVENVSYDIAPDGKSVTVQMILRIFVKVVRPAQLQVVTGVSGVAGLQVTKDVIRTEEVVGENTAQTIVKQSLTVPSPKPAVKQVIDHIATSEITSHRIVPNKVIVAGLLHLKTVYEGQTADQSIHAMEHDIPFEYYVEIPGAMPEMVVYPSVKVEYISYDVPPAGNPITVQVVLEIFAKVVRVRSLEVVTDVSGVPGLSVTKELLRVQEVRGENSAQTIIKETLPVPETKPPVDQVLDHRASMTITKTIVLPGKLVVDGVMSLKTIYVALNPYQTVHAMHHDVPFEVAINLPGAQPGMVAGATARLEHVSYEVPAAGNPITVQAVIKVKGHLYQTKQVEVVTDVVMGAVYPPPPPPCTGTITGDSVNVRSGPGMDYAPFTQVNKGTVVTLLDKQGEWFKVRLPDQREGWINARYIQTTCWPAG
ncbi:MAG: DUF3794 domain-containing protein [Firmicutes bacterium]|nr:DUF3794 domain-containing protein [Bacillota bacterium]MCL5038770.1 DUF3794 domain-containing protein [Bacillota bacterium]